MSKATWSLKLIEALDRRYKPRDYEIPILLKYAQMNKLLLGFLRAADINDDRFHEEERYKWFMDNTIEVIKVINDLNYALYKFRKPIDHVSVDLDILIDVKDVHKAVSKLRELKFKIVVAEPYTITLVRRGFIVDLYTHPAFAWIVYMNGELLLKDYVEDFYVNGFPAKSLTKEAEVVVSMAHAIYKEHMYLLIDHILMKKWFCKGIWRIAEEFKVSKAIEKALEISRLIDHGFIEAPYKIPFKEVLKLYIYKALEDEIFRATTPNILKYMLLRGGGWRKVYWRFKRETY